MFMHRRASREHPDLPPTGRCLVESVGALVQGDGPLSMRLEPRSAAVVQGLLADSGQPCIPVMQTACGDRV